MQVRVEVPDYLWVRFREEVKRRYGRLRGNIPRAVAEALDMWVNQNQKSRPPALTEEERLAFIMFCVKKLSHRQIEARGLDPRSLRSAFESLKEKLLKGGG